MTLILDYSDARPEPAAIKAAGYDGVMRYLAPDNPLTHGKILFAPERDLLLEAGLSIGLIFEWTAGRAAAGLQAGVDDVHTAEEQAHALGYPEHLPIFYPADFNAGSVSVVLPYFEGVAQASTWPGGVYGDLTVSTGVLDSGYATLAWQCCAWSGLAVSPRAALYQRLHATVPNPIPGTDENVLIHPFPMWSSAPSKVVIHPPVPTPIPPVFKAPAPPAPDLRLGMRGAAVQALQAGMDHVFPEYSHLLVDGVFGPATYAVVREFQLRSHLTADGVVGPLTRAALRQYGIIV